GLALAELLEEVVERVVLRQIGEPRNLQVVLGDLGVALDVDANDRRAHLLHEIGKAQGCGSIGSLHRLRRRSLGGLRRVGWGEAAVWAEREPQGANRNQRGSRYRQRPTRKVPRALFGHGALVRMSHKVTSPTIKKAAKRAPHPYRTRPLGKI